MTRDISKYSEYGMKRIARTSGYYLRLDEYRQLSKICETKGFFTAVNHAFLTGFESGYRAHKAEIRKESQK